MTATPDTNSDSTTAEGSHHGTAAEGSPDSATAADGLDDVHVESQPALASLNEWIRSTRLDADFRATAAAALLEGPDLRTLIEAHVPDVDSGFVAALGRLPTWADTAVRIAVSDAFTRGLKLRVDEFLEPVPSGLDHVGVEVWTTDTSMVLLVRIPVRVACGA